MARLVDLLDSLGIKYKNHGEDHHTRYGWVQLECPFCGKGSGKFHLGLALNADLLNCYQCGRHSVRETLHELTGKGYGELKKLTSGLERPRYDVPETTAGTLVLPRGIEDLGSPHRRYLRSREVFRDRIDELERLWEIRGLGVTAGIKRDDEWQSLAWRIFAPVVWRGKVVSWTSRATSDKGLRWLSAKASEEYWPHRKLLYGEDYCRGACIIHEGPTDVWNVGPGAVGTFSLSYTRSQILKMTKYGVRAICFDSEPEAQKRARELAAILEVYDGRTLVIELDASDAGSATRSEVRKLRRAVFGTE